MVIRRGLGQNVQAMLGHVSHKPSLDAGSMTGVLVASEGPQTYTSLHRVQCQGALLFQQQRRLDDAHLSNYIKTLFTDETGTAAKPHEAIVCRTVATLGYQLLCKLQQMAALSESCAQLRESNAAKLDLIKSLTAELEEAQARHQALNELNATAVAINKTPSVLDTSAEIQKAAAAILAKKSELDYVAQRSQTVTEETKKLSQHMNSVIAHLEEYIAAEFSEAVAQEDVEMSG